MFPQDVITSVLTLCFKSLHRISKRVYRKQSSHFANSDAIDESEETSEVNWG